MALKMAYSCVIANFVASSGRLQSFKKLHQIRSKMICGESGIVDCSVIDDFKTLYHEKIQSFNPDDVFNCDETGLFFKCTPSRSLCHIKEKQISGKFSKKRVTILFCVSMTGEKLKPLLIGKFKNPRGFKNLDFNRLGISYEQPKVMDENRNIL
ncbi:Jerky like protein-like [Dictyocoela muelleri]|nr:Jerky like protein-like [Dictyocoela muelleri]